MLAEHIAMIGVGLTVLAGLVQVVRGMTKVEVTVKTLSVAMGENTKATKETADKCASIDSRVSRLEGRMGIGA